jgi:hypothetical protein
MLVQLQRQCCVDWKTGSSKELCYCEGTSDKTDAGKDSELLSWEALKQLLACACAFGAGDADDPH